MSQRRLFSVRKPLLAACALAGAAAAIVAGPAIAGSEQIRLDYGVYAGGMRAVTAEVAVQLGGMDYSISIEAKPRGLLAALAPWRSEARTAGILAAGRLSPKRHRLTDTWRGGAKTIQLDYDGDGGVAVWAEPASTLTRKAPVPVELRHGTFDPLSALFAIAADMADGRPCAGTVPVYDGQRRYDMALTAAGSQDVRKTSYSVFSGKADGCRIESHLLAGKPWKKGVFGNAGPSRPPMTMLVAPIVPGSPPVPVRIETDSAFGPLVVHLSRIERTGQTAQLPR